MLSLIGCLPYIQNTYFIINFLLSQKIILKIENIDKSDDANIHEKFHLESDWERTNSNIKELDIFQSIIDNRCF